MLFAINSILCVCIKCTAPLRAESFQALSPDLGDMKARHGWNRIGLDEGSSCGPFLFTSGWAYIDAPGGFYPVRGFRSFTLWWDDFQEKAANSLKEVCSQRQNDESLGIEGDGNQKNAFNMFGRLRLSHQKKDS